MTNAIASTLHALGARLFSEGMPMHALADGKVQANADGSFKVNLNPGSGSGVQVEGYFEPGQPLLPAPFSECWASYRDFLAYSVPQDRAFSSQPCYGRLTRQEIALGIPLESCDPWLAGLFRTTRPPTSASLRRCVSEWPGSHSSSTARSEIH